MDQQGQRGRSPSAGRQPPHIKQSHSPSRNPYPPNEPSVGLGLSLDPSASQPFPGAASTNDYSASYNNADDTFAQPFGRNAIADSATFDPSQSFSQQLKTDDPAQAAFLNPTFNDADFSLFPPTTDQDDQYNAPLFEQPINPDMNNMATPQTHHSPTPPHLLNPEPHQPGSAHQSPAFNQHQFSSSPGSHSRNVSLGPEAALLPNQLNEWTQPQFQGHRRSPSEYSDVSSAAPSPNLVSQDVFDHHSEHGHSPMQQPSDPGLYQEINMGNFSISDSQHSPHLHGRSPSHSPAISPRILPQQLPDMNPPAFGAPFGTPAYPGIPVPAAEAFPTLQQPSQEMPQMVAPAINIDFAPTSRQNSFEPPKPPMDHESLTPPERGRPKSRPRAVTDPFNAGGGAIARPHGASSLSPHLGSDLSTSNTSRSLSPLDRSSTSPSRRRQSTSAVPNNVIALRLADPDYQNSQDNGSTKRIQKHPATFQCTLCPKRFTRAYNLRSHLRTHTDERPFVCTVCGKAFARQHDRKRHEGLHSGEKKFVCKGELKAGASHWGCGRRFARADALGRHFRSEAGRICIKPLLDEEMMERQRLWQEQRMQQNMAAQNMAAPQLGMEPSAYPMDAGGQYALPAALLAQYPALAQMNWSQDMSGGMDDELSGRSSFDASDYDEGDDGGYVSGPGTGYGEGSMAQGYGEMGYASDYGGR